MATPLYKVKAVYDYTSEHEDDLNFPVGQIIAVTEEEDADWYVGEYMDASGQKQEGLFPRNFVERFEPAAPPRPTRSRPKKEIAVSPEAPKSPTEPLVQESEVVAESAEPIETANTVPPPAPKPQPAEPASVNVVPEPPQEPKQQPVKSETTAKSPPPVATKPSSFKDRIAAFNKTEQPLAPIKPGPPGSGSGNTFIKKPFVAPPPSKNSYVPPPTKQAAPQKIYRREEDPEILERQAQDQEDAERAGLISGEGGEEGEATEDQPKPTSLKDRIALLQKQQEEQAARRAEAAKKDKPAKPPKKTAEPIEATEYPDEAAEEEEEYSLEQVPSPGSRNRQSLDAPRETPRPPAPSTAREPITPLPEISDGNEADQSGAGDTTEDAEQESTEVEDSDEKSKPRAPAPPPRASTSSSRGLTEPQAMPESTAIEAQEGEEEDEQEEMDDETRRKLELRERMAKMSGGMGMPGMFGVPKPGPAPRAKRPSGTSDNRQSTEQERIPTSPPAPPQRIPVIPGASRPQVQSPVDEEELQVEREPEAGAPISAEREPDEVPDVEDVQPTSSIPPRPQDRAAPPVPQERPIPPAPPQDQRGAPPPVPTERPVPPPAEARPPPPPPPRGPQSPSSGSASDEESSAPAQQPSQPPPVPARDLPTRAPPPPIPGVPPASKPEGPRSPPTKRTSYTQEITSPVTPSSPSSERRQARVPPVPGEAAMTRPPPPPPPSGAPPSRHSTGLSEAENGESDYEGDYDTDIASGVPHKNALKAHARESSLDESTLYGDIPRSPATSSTQRAPPPPPPTQAAPVARQSMDAPRGPPPVPPVRDPAPPPPQEEDEYDPYRYSEPAQSPPPTVLPTHRKAHVPNVPVMESDPTLYGGEPQSPPPQERAPPPPPHADARQSRDLSRVSVEVPRSSLTATRKSAEYARHSMEHDQIARDVDLSSSTLWWAEKDTPPPAFQNRQDLLYEVEESSTSKRGGKTTVSRDIYVLFQDYSQTVINVRFDAKKPSDATLEQRHEPPPLRLRQEQLEQAHAQFGAKVYSNIASKQNHTEGDGTAQGLVLGILRSIPNALLPIGTRAYGALVYANMANATVQQHDEIRPGDIISFRNARFQGKHGTMHAKYSEDVGKPDHVAVVIEWDGTKKKVRALEQGRQSKKVKAESFKVGDLRSGEVKIWRVMGRSWVGWESG